MASYCFWSVCDGEYAGLMERCARSARAAGVFKEFHVLTDRVIEGCNCYDCYQFEKAGGYFKLHYLKAGMNRVNFDWFIWIDADTLFVRNPLDILGPLGKSPVHVPLELNLSSMSLDREWGGVSCFRLRELMQEAGIANQAYLCGSAFWIVHHDVIDALFDLVCRFRKASAESGVEVGVSAALGYGMQMLCANPERHLLSENPEVWASDDLGCNEGAVAAGRSWLWRHPLAEHDQGLEVRPALIHVPTRKGRGAEPKPLQTSITTGSVAEASTGNTDQPAANTILAGQHNE